MTTHPAAPLIIVTEGSCYGANITRTVATPIDIGDPAGGYYLISGAREGFCVTPSAPGDKITAWEDATAVPLDALERAIDAFSGAELTEEQEEALQALEPYTN